MILVDSWSKLDFKAASKLLIGGIFGIPIGMYALIYAPESIIKGIFGIAAYRFFCLQSRQTAPLPYPK
ncbi:MAG: hypothetical protein R3C26_03910 [Calditrichia bacterium]